MADAIERIRLIKYAILQTTIGPSLICDLFVFIYFIRHWRKEILTMPQNHVILCLLIVSFIQKITDVLFYLYLLRWGIFIRQTYTFCVIWNWWGYSSICMNLHLLTWCCIERHLFVFHSQMMKKKWCLILFHYIPIIVCLIYTPLFYTAVIFFPTSCDNFWDYTVIYCGGACYSFVPLLGTFDWLFHYGIPPLIICFTNIILFLRFIWQKIKLQRPVEWRRQKRMIIQLAFICVLYLILLSPSVIFGVIETLWSRDFLSDIQYNYFYHLLYFINQFLPFIIASSLPEMHKEVKQWKERVSRRFGRGMQIHPFLTTIGTDGKHGTVAATA